MNAGFTPYCAYLLLFTLLGAIFSTGFPLTPAMASHTNIILDDNIDLVYDPNDTIVISGTIDDVNDDEDVVDLEVTGPSTSDDDNVDHDDGDFEFEYDIDPSAEDG